MSKNPNANQFELPLLKRLFKNFYINFMVKGYFQEAFGYDCADAGPVAGRLGFDIETQILRKLRKMNLWPIQDKCDDFSEDDIFDIIEFLYDNISKPLEGNFHSYSGCGWHYHSFDTKSGREEYRQEVNELLKDYKDGYVLDENGEILTLAELGLEYLFQANIPQYNPENIDARVNAAILKFRRYKSSIDERRDAIRDLADVLEYLRPKLRVVITKNDESDLFNIANNFGIRHHNEIQKTEYERAIWYSWIFYYYLATIHAVLRLIRKHEENESQ
jgi:hypothetical protein